MAAPYISQGPGGGPTGTAYNFACPIHQGGSAGVPATILVMAITSPNDTHTTPTDWNLITETVSTGIAAMAATAQRTSIYWRRAIASTPDVPITLNQAHANNYRIVTIIAVEGCVDSGDPVDASASSSISTASTSISVPGATTTVADTLVIVCAADTRDSNAANRLSAWTNADLTNIGVQTGSGYIDGFDTNSAIGSGGGLYVSWGTKTTAGAYGSTTSSLGVSSTQGRISIALKPYVPSAASTGTAAGTSTASATAAATAYASTVMRDGPKGWLVPQTAAEFTAVGWPIPDFFYGAQDVSGSLLNSIGTSVPLASIGTGKTYQESVPGWSRKFLRLDGLVSGQGWRTSSSLWDLAAGRSAAMVSLGSFVLPTSGQNKTLFLIAGTNISGVNITPTTGLVRTAHAGVAANGNKDHSGIDDVHQFAWYRRADINLSGTETDLESITGPHEEGALIGQTKGIATTASPPDARIGWHAIYLDANAERDWATLLANLRKATGNSNATATSSSLAIATATSAGTATVTATSSTIAVAIAIASGTATATADSAIAVSASATATGTATAAATATALVTADATSAGLSIADASARSLAVATATGAGTSTAEATSSFLANNDASLNVTLDDATLESNAKAPASASFEATAADAWLEADARAAIVASLNVTLEDATSAGNSKAFITAEHASILADATLVSTVQVSVKADLAVSTADATLESLVKAAATGYLYQNLDAATLYANAQARLNAALNATAANATLVAQARVQARTNLTVNLADAKLTAQALVTDIRLAIQPGYQISLREDSALSVTMAAVENPSVSSIESDDIAVQIVAKSVEYVAQ